MENEYKIEESPNSNLFDLNTPTKEFNFRQLEIAIDNFQKAFIDSTTPAEEKDTVDVNSILASNKLSLSSSISKMNTFLLKFTQSTSIKVLPNDFPYQQLCYLLNSSQNAEYQKQSLICLHTALTFSEEDIEIITQSEIETLCLIIHDQTHRAKNEALQMIHLIMKHQTDFCQFFFDQKLPDVLLSLYPNRIVLEIIKLSFQNLDLQCSIPYLLIIFHNFEIDDLYIKRNLYVLIRQFIDKFGIDSLPETFTKNETDIEIIPFIYSSLYGELDKLAKNPDNYELLNCFLDFCLCLPPANPPEILDQIIFFTTINEAFPKDESNKIHLNASEVLIHFAEIWKEVITQDFLIFLSKQILGDDIKEDEDMRHDYDTKLSYTKIILTYHAFQNNEFDTDVIRICLEYLHNSDPEFQQFCIAKMHEIFVGFSNTNNLELLEICASLLMSESDSFSEHIENIDSDSISYAQIIDISQITNDFMAKSLAADYHLE